MNRKTLRKGLFYPDSCKKRILRATRLGLLSFFVGVLSLSASPQAVEAKVTVDVSNKPLGSVFETIKNQSSYSFWFDANEVDVNQPVSVKAKNESVSKVLTKVLANQDLAYQLADNHIVITKRETSSTIQSAQQDAKTITGTVVDDSGEALIGVSVAVKGTTVGTVTDYEGKYSLKASAGQTLVLSYVGYVTKEMKVGANSIVDVVMSESDISLDAVVVTALGIKRSQKALSYNTQQIGGDEVNTVKDANFINSLTGKVAGVNINSSSTGVGGATKVVIRGSKSIESNNNVLYVVDGIPLMNIAKGGLDDGAGVYSSQPVGGEGISDINPDDIESMTVLTGPSASALYGSNAANGAIVITTKKGQEGKAKVTVSNQTTFMNPFVMPKFQNSYGNRAGQYQSWGDKLETPSSYNPKDFFNTGSNVQNSISLSVGNSKNQTYASAATSNAEGIMPNNKYNRYNFTLRNTTSFLNDKMTLDFGINYVIQDNKNMTAQGEYFNPLGAVYTYPRGENFDSIRMFEEYNDGRDIYTQRWPWSDEGLSLQNPYWTANRNVFTNKRKRYMLNASLKYEILDWVDVQGRVKVDNEQAEETKKLYASTMSLLAEKNGSYARSKVHDDQVYADVLVNINKYFSDDYSLSANIGASILDAKSDRNGFTGNLDKMPNFFALKNIKRTDAKTRVLETNWHQQTQSVFANVELGWKSMLYLTLTGRNDWDSALARMPKKSFFYPSVGLSGVVTEMVKLPKFINYMKVRGSYASVGSSIPRQMSIHHYPYDESTNSWATQTYMPIGELFPERTKSWEGGLEMKFWQNRFNIDVTVYRSNTYDQTITVPISASSGYSSIIAQTGDIQNQGVEFLLGFNEKWRDFSWSSTFTASTNRNKIVDLGKYTMPNGEIVELDNIRKTRIGSSQILLTNGGTLGDIWTTTELKRDSNGNIYVDGDGNVSSQENIQKVGSVLPKWNLGFSNNFTWKDLSVGFVLSARIGGKGISYTQAIMDSFGVSKASADARDNGGIPVNNGYVDAEKWYKVVGGTAGIYSHYIYSATNVRLQEASVGYRLPSSWFDNKVRVSASLVGRNLWMIYNKAPFDPESVASTSDYYQGLDYLMSPSLRSFGFNLKLEF